MTGGPASDMMGLVIYHEEGHGARRLESLCYIPRTGGQCSGAPRSARNTRQVSHPQLAARRDPRRVTAPVY